MKKISDCNAQNSIKSHFSFRNFLQMKPEKIVIKIIVKNGEILGKTPKKHCSILEKSLKSLKKSLLLMKYDKKRLKKQ